MSIGEKIIKLRKERGYSQEDLAREIEVSRQSISKWELNESSPDAENLLKLSKLFAVSIDYLLDETKMHSSNNASNFLGFIKRHWAKVGYYLAATGFIGTVIMWVLNNMTKSMFNDAWMGDVFPMSNPIKNLSVFTYIPLAVMIVGIVLIIYDRIIARKYHK